MPINAQSRLIEAEKQWQKAADFYAAHPMSYQAAKASDKAHAAYREALHEVTK